MASGDLQRDGDQGAIAPRSTIFALATGAPPTAIAIVRISGPSAWPTLAAMTRQALPPVRQLAIRTLIDPQGNVIDRGLVVAFAGPESVTGDDLVELHVHGGVAVVGAVLDCLRDHGLSPAARGEFTRRAFDNGKLDLGQVEALGDLIAARTESQRRAALSRSGTALGEQVGVWRSILLAARVDVEATLDFAEEDGVPAALTSEGRSSLIELRRQIAIAYDQSRRAERLNDGITVTIVGPTNAGKSTLINALARRDAAIVSATPGTTRDIVEVRLVLAGVPVTLVDTAGYRDTSDSVEAEGIRRGAERAAAADLVIDLGKVANSGDICVRTKSDLRSAGSGWKNGVLHLSAATGAGVDLLEQHLAERVGDLVRLADAPLVAHRWQMAALASADQAIGTALDAHDIVLVAEGLRQATSALERLIGRVSSELLLDGIFSRFCIGK